MVSKQTLAVALSRLKAFHHASLALEQYATESELAAELLWHAHMRGLIAGKRVLDLGAGTGILAVGAALLGAAEVVAVEKDEAAFKVLRQNLEMYEGCEQVRPLLMDVAAFGEQGDVVVMNPPFGTKERHADRFFLEKAAALAPVIYTIHKSTTDNFVRAFAHDSHLTVVWAERRRFPIKRSMAHHEKPRKDVEVTVYCLERKA
jgi:putative methylase